MIIYDSWAFFSSFFFFCSAMFSFLFFIFCLVFAFFVYSFVHSIWFVWYCCCVAAGCIAIISFMRKIIGMQLEKSMEKWGACSQSVKTIKMEDFPNATLFLLYHQTEKQLVSALHCLQPHTPRDDQLFSFEPTKQVDFHIFLFVVFHLCKNNMCIV